MGDIVTGRLSESFSNLMDYGFTAGMEENLDDVAQGERDWKNVLDEFYGDFRKKLEVAEAADGGMRANQPVMTDIRARCAAVQCRSVRPRRAFSWVAPATACHPRNAARRPSI